MPDPDPVTTPLFSAADTPSSPHRRRARYPGKNPRRFEDKYKELNPDRYRTDVTKVIAAGKTPAGSHRPIMVNEILEVLRLKPGELVVDCTLGFGGHAGEILNCIATGKTKGRLLGLDVDPIELPKATTRLRDAGWSEEVFTSHRSNFAGLPKLFKELGLGAADAILADLGVSSMQLDDPSRGFTFKHDGPLDLRLNPQRTPSAAQWLARVSATNLATVLRDNSDEPQAELIARELVDRQKRIPFVRTKQLSDALRNILHLPKASQGQEVDDTSIRRVFQALRIAVNDEFAALESLLRNLPFCLKPGGRVAILTFHSGEDRRVKQSFREGTRAGIYLETNDTLIRPSLEELRQNPRSASAKLRWALRT